MSADHHFTIQQEGTAQLREKASRFIGIAFHVRDEESFRHRLVSVKKEHHTARHWCWAYVLGDDGQVHRSQDDGEPSGTAGKPILRHIQGRGLTYTAVIVVRYFGGTLLGKGGLVQAYGDTARAALEQAVIIEEVARTRLTIICTYPQLDRVRSDVAAMEGVVVDGSYGDRCRLEVELPRGRITAALERWALQGIGATVMDQAK
jgi:uncharacterized YigZ family protein